MRILAQTILFPCAFLIIWQLCYLPAQGDISSDIMLEWIYFPLPSVMFCVYCIFISGVITPENVHVLQINKLKTVKTGEKLVISRYFSLSLALFCSQHLFWHLVLMNYKTRLRPFSDCQHKGVCGISRLYPDDFRKFGQEMHFFANQNHTTFWSGLKCDSTSDTSDSAQTHLSPDAPTVWNLKFLSSLPRWETPGPQNQIDGSDIVTDARHY